MAAEPSSDELHRLAENLRALALKQDISAEDAEVGVQRVLAGGWREVHEVVQRESQSSTASYGYPAAASRNDADGAQDPLAAAVESEKERQRQATSLQGQSRKRPDRTRLLAEIAESARMPRIPKNPKKSSVHFLVVREPYLPCIVPVHDLSIMMLADLKYEMHHRAKKLVVRRMGKIAVGRSSTIVAVEDASGDLEALQIFHCDPYFANELSEGTAFVIKEPYYTLDEYKDGQIRVNHPSDLIILDPEDSTIPDEWRQSSINSMSAIDYKIKGNEALRQKNLTGALRLYTKGIQIMNRGILGGVDLSARRDLFRNRAHVNLSLGRNDAALADALAALPDQTPAGSRSLSAPTLEGKAYYRAACAAYNLREYTKAKVYLEQQQTMTPDDSEGVKLMQKTMARLAEQSTPANYAQIIRTISAKQPRVDVASYLVKTEIKASPGRGRGLFATADINPAEIIISEKAISAVWEHEEASYLAYKYSTRTDDLRVSNWGLLQETVQHLTRNPSLISQIVELHGLWPGVGKESLVIDGQAVIDTFQIHDIVVRNSFRLSELTKVHAARPITGDIAMNSGLWIRISYTNHSCIPNATRNNIGDIMTIRADKPIKKGEEILISYNTIDPYLKRKEDMQHVWAFRCTCPLCEAESQDTNEVLERRRELEERIEPFLSKHTTGNRYAMPPKAAITEAETLASDLRATYDERRFRDVPRIPLSEVHCWLISAYGPQRARTRFHACEVLRLLCYEVVDKPKTSVSVTGRTAVTPKSMVALQFLSAVLRTEGDLGGAKRLEEMANDIFKTGNNGSLEGCIDTDLMVV